jgi:hypothetical protein
MFPLQFYAREVFGNSYLIQKVDQGAVALSDPAGIIEVDYLFNRPPVVQRKTRFDASAVSRAWVILSDWESMRNTLGYSRGEGYEVVKRLSGIFGHREIRQFNDFAVYLFNN